MYSEKMHQLGTNRSVIRDLFEYGNQRKAEIGPDKVFDFSIGNPSVPAPQVVTDTLCQMVKESDPMSLHSYTSAQGDAATRQAIADYVNGQHGTDLTGDNFYMTCGAAASLTISLKALYEEGDEFIVFSPFFPEYRVFIEGVGGKLVQVDSRREDFQIDPATFEAAITDKTKAVIVNSPNNPSGVVLTEDCIKSLCAVLEKKQKEYGKEIFLIADEPYRELVYGDVKVPYLMNYYDNTLVCYSYSKSLSLPGDRIGYIAVSNKAKDWKDLYAAICGAGRVLGYVCAPSLFQKLIGKCQGQTADISIYKKNRDILYEALTSYGFRCIAPDGAFYLFMETPEEDATAFGEKAKKHELLLVPADSFGTPGFVRISYCVSTEQIQNSLPAFKALAQEYGL
ncbi:MAG: pyridoxal phosphate-dependent aminotransferase [Eubacterium sp.]|nr:pyridoxal phosphate-dependent aminotransferase [Eubacterium sp.]